MFSISKSTAILATVLSVAAVPANAETLVIRSSGPSAKLYPPGKSIADGGKITLKAGDVVTILDSRGTRILKTPGTFSTAATLTSTNSAISAMLKNTGTRVGRTGATRGFEQPRSIWLVDSTRAGKMCIADAKSVLVWRPASEAPAMMTITRISDGKTASLSFKTRISEALWPVTELPIVAGSEYRLSGAGMAKPVSVTLVNLDANAQDVAAALPALDKQGCSAQFDKFVETLAVPKDEPTPVS